VTRKREAKQWTQTNSPWLKQKLLLYMPALLHSTEGDAVSHHLEIPPVCTYGHYGEQEGMATYSADF